MTDPRTGRREQRRGMGLGATILFWFLLLSLVPLLAVSFTSYRSARQGLHDDAEASLTAVASIKAARIQGQFRQMLTDLRFQAQSQANVAFLGELQAALTASGVAPDLFTRGPGFENIVLRHGAALRELRRTYGYRDVLLLGRGGDLLFSVAREDHLGTNILTGKHSGTRFAAACKRSLASGRSTFSDFERYAATGGAPAGFLVAALVDEEGDRIGLIALHIGLSQVDLVMKERTGLGRTGETYLVGADLKMRSNSALEAQPVALKERVSTDLTRRWKGELDTRAGQKPGAGAAGSGGSDALLYRGRRGVPVLGISYPLRIAGVPLAMIAEIEQAEAFARSSRLAYLVAAMVLFTVLAVIGVGATVASRIVWPVKRLSLATRRVADGDLDKVVDVRASGEVGDLATDFDQMLRSLREVVRQAGAISDGDFLAEVAVRGDRDQLGLAMQRMTRTLQGVAGVAEAIAEGDLSREVEVRGERDLLGRALSRMSASLAAAMEDSQRKVSFLDQVPGPVVVMDPEFNIQFLNLAAAEWADRPREACVGLKCFELFKNEHCGTGQCQCARAMVDDAVRAGVTTLSLPGGPRPIRYLGAPIKDDQGLIVGLVEYIIDISDEMKVADLARQVSEGDYSVAMEPRFEGDLLTGAINRMTSDLAAAAERDLRERWIGAARAELAGEMLGQHDLPTLSGRAVSLLARHVGASVGALYSAAPDDALALIGGYALPPGLDQTRRIAPGEGLIGQAALEQELVVVDQVPPDYIKISSGSVEAAPRALAMVPLIHDGAVQGVLELGAADAFSEAALELLQAVAPAIAVALHTAHSQQRLQGFLDESRRQAAELKNRTHELHQQAEELRAVNEELEERSEALSRSEAALRRRQASAVKANEAQGEAAGRWPDRGEHGADDPAGEAEAVRPATSAEYPAVHVNQASPPARESRGLAGRRVLLVEDEPASARALSAALSMHGVEVLLAGDGRAALDRLADGPPVDLVLMDIMMPVMDGYEATRRIKADRRLSALPVLALTARSLPEDRDRCIEAGADDYLTKPLDLDKLLSLMRAWLHR